MGLFVTPDIFTLITRAYVPYVQVLGVPTGKAVIGAGIMLRADEKHWIKTGIEYVDGVQNLSAVVTHDYSDWSVIPLPNPPDVLHLRVERSKEAIQIFYLNEASNYAMLRMTYLPYETLQVGVMCASPDGDGFEVTFEDYQLNATGS